MPGAFGDITEIKNVPLVTYRAGGERVEIGSAEVRPDGTVTARVEAPAFAGLLDTAVDGFSFGLGAPPVDVLAELRAENRRLRGEVKRLSETLADQMRKAAVMRRDVAELARQAGVLLEGQGGS